MSLGGTLTTCFSGWVSGNTGDDTIVLNNCNMIQVSALTRTDVGVDGKDIIEINNSTWTNADGGESDDRFIGSGDNSNSVLHGGAGPDDFAIGGTFVGGQIRGDGEDDIVTGSGNWNNAVVYGNNGADRIDLRACFGDVAIFGGNDNDRIYGGTGNDRIAGEGGSDWMSGMEGDDYFDAVDGLNDIVYGGAHDKGDSADVDSSEYTVHGVEFISVH